MKLLIFWEKRFFGNRFRDLSLDPNLSPFMHLSQLNGDEHTLSFDQVANRKDKSEFVCLCLLNFSLRNIVLYLKLFLTCPRSRKYLFLLEPPVVAPLSYMRWVHMFFDRVYTWRDDWVDGKKYHKFIWPQSRFGSVKTSIPFHEKKFICLINANKFSPFSKELYSAREDFIRFCEEHNVDFDLFGRGWDRANLKQKVFGFRKFTSYRWSVADKLSTLAKYKFNFCFENMHEVPGYITEKIWDSFKSRTVPVYLGASNITQYVPAGTFVDAWQFRGDYKKLIQHLQGMSAQEYQVYQSNIDQFMATRDAQSWFDETWAEAFLTQISSPSNR